MIDGPRGGGAQIRACLSACAIYHNAARRAVAEPAVKSEAEPAVKSEAKPAVKSEAKLIYSPPGAHGRDSARQGRLAA